VGGVFPCHYRPGPRSVLARPLHRTTIRVIATRPRPESGGRARERIGWPKTNGYGPRAQEPCQGIVPLPRMGSSK
jgi:hypothetical protein